MRPYQFMCVVAHASYSQTRQRKRLRGGVLYDNNVSRCEPRCSAEPLCCVFLFFVFLLEFSFPVCKPERVYPSLTSLINTLFFAHTLQCTTFSVVYYTIPAKPQRLQCVKKTQKGSCVWDAGTFASGSDYHNHRQMSSLARIPSTMMSGLATS